jgi:predicted transcriptional regulator
MTVKELIEKLDLKILVEDDLEREVKDCYIGDLLSWVMGRAPEDSAWLTVMGNINSIAVATLADVSCIILVENAALDDEAKNKAETHGVTILSTQENSYSLAIKIHDLIS